MKITIWVAVGVMLLGIGLFVSGLNPPRYNDDEEFQRRYMLLGPGKSKEFRELRRAHLTYGFTCQDYGITLALVGLSLPWLVRWRAVVSRLPKSRATTFWLGVLAAVATTGSELASLFLDLSRGAFPWWADSIIIPIMGMPIVLFGLIIWSGTHALLVRRNPDSFSELNLRGLNLWLAVLTFLTAACLLYALAVGDFFAFVPAVLWLAFYFAIWRSRR